MFSSRVPPASHAQRIFARAATRRGRLDAIIDLTITNPTRAGFDYPANLFAPLSQSPAALAYDPAPFGLRMPRARPSLADYARRATHGRPADRIVLTSSTSEAYSVLFKLLCEPAGDSVLTPAPSYPLFEHLTALDGVTPVPYMLEYHGRWWVDSRASKRRGRPRTRALLAVSPNNPTGSCLSRRRARGIVSARARRAARH